MEKSLVDELNELKKRGLKFSDCVEAFGVDHSNAYAKAAAEQCTVDGEVEVDDPTVLSQSENGSYVMAWVWVSNEDAGILTNSGVLEAMLVPIQELFESGDAEDNQQNKQLNVYALWLEEVILNFSDELDGLDGMAIKGTSEGIDWVHSDGSEHRFKPSEAIESLNAAASTFGVEKTVTDKVSEFLRLNGEKLNFRSCPFSNCEDGVG